MFNFQQKIVKHTNEKKYVLFIEKKNSQPIETVLEEVQMLDLLDRNINSIIINMFKELTEAMFKDKKQRASV